MNRWQKVAWFNLIVIGTGLSLSSIAFIVLLGFIGIPRAFGSFGFMGICGLMGLSPILFRKKQGQIALDERDELIQKKALLNAYVSFWVIFVGMCMIPWFVIGPKGSITVNILPWMVIGGMVIVEAIRSLSILVQYRQGGKDGRR